MVRDHQAVPDNYKEQKLRKLRIPFKHFFFSFFFFLESKFLLRTFSQWNILSSCILFSSKAVLTVIGRTTATPLIHVGLKTSILQCCRTQQELLLLTGTDWKFCFPSVLRLPCLPKWIPCGMSVQSCWYLSFLSTYNENRHKLDLFLNLT